MREGLEIKNRILYLDGKKFVDEVMGAPILATSNLFPKAKWLTFNSASMERHLGKKIEEVCQYIFDLRRAKDHERAIDLSDIVFESFTPLMNAIVEQSNFYQISNMWDWLIEKVRKTEERTGTEFGKGVHKGTAFYFLGFSKLMMGDIDGAYLSFAEAAKDDEILPQSVLNRHQKGLPPVVKILLLDLSQDNFAYHIVREIRSTINGWEQMHPHVSRSKSIFDSVQNAINKNAMPRESAIHFCYAFTKAFILQSRKESYIRPTFLTITQLGESILRFARTLEDLIRVTQDLRAGDKLFAYCYKTWFCSENWNVSSYEDKFAELVSDFAKNEWKLSKDGRNLLFCLKARNALAHRIPDDPILFNRYVEITLAISSSFGFVCDEISK